MSSRRSRSSRDRRHSSQATDDRVVQLSSDEEAYDREQPLVRDGTSALPDGGFSALPEEQQDELEKRLIRYMLCRNARKRPVSRPDLTKYVFANMNNIRSKPKVFKGTMAKAQNTLRAVFGMEIVQIQKQLKMRNVHSQKTATMKETATQSGAPDGQKGYILVSMLPTSLRGEDEKNKALIGFLTVVGALILLEPSCRIEQETLYRSLEKIGVLVREKRGHKQINSGNVKELLEQTLLQQWYLEREREDQTYFYTLGPRFRAEIEDEDLIEFVNAVYNKNEQQESWLDETSKKELQMRLDEAIGKTREDPDDADDMED